MWHTIQSYKRVCKVRFQVSVKSYHKPKNLFVLFSVHFSSTHRRSTRICTFVALHTVHSAHTVADSRPWLYSFIKCCYYYHCRRSQCIMKWELLALIFIAVLPDILARFTFSVSLPLLFNPFHRRRSYSCYTSIWYECNARPVVHVVCVHVSIYCVCSVCQR